MTQRRPWVQNRVVLNSWSWVWKSSKRAQRVKYLKKLALIRSCNYEIKNYIARWIGSQADNVRASKRANEDLRTWNLRKAVCSLMRSWVNEGKFESWNGEEIKKRIWNVNIQRDIKFKNRRSWFKMGENAWEIQEL